jgi:hypothetical protein
LGALETYLTAVRDTRLSGEGVSELSYYPALHALLEDVGGKLKPKVRCFMNLRNQGAGLPDGGLFTADQVRGSRAAKAGQASAAAPGDSDLGSLIGQKPARGAIEVKPPGADVAVVAASQQVQGYLAAYRQMLVTNLREFLLLGYDTEGKPVTLERYSLAATEAEFWNTVAVHPRRAEIEQGERFLEFLRRALLSGATLASPQDLAWFLASYAREARFRVETAAIPALDAVRTALEETLGVKFEGEKGDHFFRSTLVQTLFYGLFASWVMWSHEHELGDGGATAPGATQAAGGGAAPRFDWRSAAWTMRVPVIQGLFTQIATPARLGSLGLVPVLDLAAAALNRVDRRAFFGKFEQHHAVQYFYEPFLEAFDPELRKELGVWYTPPEIVEYMVARVDTVLREELDVPDGLADPRVYVLDPCCGTGAYLVEVLEKIAQTLDEKGADALSAGDVKKAALERVFGFEILPAPFVIAHMQLGLLLQNMHLPLGDQEWVGVFLTNALTGWESPHGHQQMLPWPELEAERDAAERVKQELPILVVLGNPPYNGYAGISTGEEGGLVEPYKQGLASEWGITKNYLDDLYVRFFRVAERRIAEMTGRGVVCYISNFSYLSDPSSVVLRKRLLSQFEHIWVDCLNGDSRETGKKTPWGAPDPSVFSTSTNREGIQVGTAVLTMGHNDPGTGVSSVRFREFWGVSKKDDLIGSLANGEFSSSYSTLEPSPRNRFSLRPWVATEEYDRWPSVVDLARTNWLLGLNENRGGALVDSDRDTLEQRMQEYFDADSMLQVLPESLNGLRQEWARFDPAKTRATLLREGYDQSKVVRFLARPFDLRWAYVETRAKLWNESRPTLVRHVGHGNRFLMARCRAPRVEDGAAFCMSRSLADQHALHKDAYLIPLVQFSEDAAQLDLLGEPKTQVNLSEETLTYLETIALGREAGRHQDAAVWLHVLALGYSPNYLHENADGIRLDWPRIPLPNSKELLLASAELGRKVADLLDPETGVDGVTAGTLRPELRVVGVPSRAGGGNLNPDAGDLAVTAGWGHAGQGGVTMPGKGTSILRPYTSEELAAIEQGAGALGLSAEQALAQLGDKAVDVYLNGVAYWRCVPSGVWSYTIGGYQVMKKWLSYREKPLLGRDLKVDEVREVRDMARRIAAVLLLQPALDASYLAVKGNTYLWGDSRLC